MTNTQNELIELLPCPLCKGTRLSEWDSGSYWELPRKDGIIRCQTCGCSAPIEAWNTRPASSAAVDALRDAGQTLSAAYDEIGHLSLPVDHPQADSLSRLHKRIWETRAALANTPKPNVGLVPDDHLKNIERAIQYCKDRNADRFGGFIVRVLRKAMHRTGCGVFDDYPCDCSALEGDRA